MSSFIEKIVGDRADKQRWLAYKSRVKALPEPHRAAVEALERYLAYRAAITNGAELVSMHKELVEAFEEAVASGAAPVDVVTGDPVRFADDLVAKYASSEWIEKERQRLIAAFAGAQGEGKRP